MYYSILLIGLFILSTRSHAGMNALLKDINDAIGSGSFEKLDLILHLDRSDQSVENNKSMQKTLDAVYIQAAKDGDLDLLNQLLKVVSPNTERNQAFKQAALHGQIQVIDKLLALDPNSGIDPFSGWNFALRFSSNGGHLEIVKRLLNINHKTYWKSSEASWNKSLQESLKMASENGHIQIVKTLLENISPSYKTFSATFDSLLANSNPKDEKQKRLEDNLSTIFNILIDKGQQESLNLIYILDYARKFHDELYLGILSRISDLQIKNKFRRRIRFNLD